MSYTIRKATPADIATIHDLAWSIWPNAYGKMISKEQMHYMLEWMYSPESLLQQMENDNHFLLLQGQNDRPVGYAAYRALEGSHWKLEKLYVLTEMHGLGLGQALLERVQQEVVLAGGTRLELQVNRKNPALQFYLKQGFQVVSDADFDIGNGFYMNDHIMARPL